MVAWILRRSKAVGRLVYAGDDENDAVAMDLVWSWGGTVVTVGAKAIVQDSDVVSSPMDSRPSGLP